VNRVATAATAILLLHATLSLADIYRWEDEAGTVHFTDDVTNIPSSFRGKSTIVVQEAPKSQAPRPADPSVQGQPPPEAGQTYSSPAGGEAATPAFTREELASRAEQLRAKIAAKEKLVKMVEDRQNLALNPDRRRIINPGDLELHNKYQVELPQDRENLRELELRLELFK
jgi:hypothetical protein